MTAPDRMPDPVPGAPTQPAPRPAARPAPPLLVGTPAAQAGTQAYAQAPRVARPATPADQFTRPIGQPQMAQMPQPRRVPIATTATPPRTPRLGAVREYVQHLNVLQAICWQLAALAVILTLQQPWPVLVCACVGAALLVALTTVRVGGRWLHQIAVIAGGYLSRPRRRDLPETGAKTPALLAMLVPGTTVQVTETSHGQAMTVSHPGGLAAVLRPRGQTGDLIGVVPPVTALLPAGGEVTDAQPHTFGVQTTIHAGVRRDGPPRVWFAVHAARTVEIPHDDELTLSLRNAMRRVRRALDRAGVPTEPLAEDAALAAVAGLAHVTGGRNEVREDWRYWRTGPVSQATFTLPGIDLLPDAMTRHLVAGMFAATSGVAVTVTISGRTGTRVSGVLRLAATTEAAVEAAVSAISARTTPAGVHLARLDGTHSSGVAASLPIGVFT